MYKRQKITQISSLYRISIFVSIVILLLITVRSAISPSIVAKTERLQLAEILGSQGWDLTDPGALFDATNNTSTQESGSSLQLSYALTEECTGPIQEILVNAQTTTDSTYIVRLNDQFSTTVSAIEGVFTIKTPNKDDGQPWVCDDVKNLQITLTSSENLNNSDSVIPNSWSISTLTVDVVFQIKEPKLAQNRYLWDTLADDNNITPINYDNLVLNVGQRAILYVEIENRSDHSSTTKNIGFQFASSTQNCDSQELDWKTIDEHSEVSWWENPVIDSTSEYLLDQNDTACTSGGCVKVETIASNKAFLTTIIPRSESLQISIPIDTRNARTETDYCIRAIIYDSETASPRLFDEYSSIPKFSTAPNPTTDPSSLNTITDPEISLEKVDFAAEENVSLELIYFEKDTGTNKIVNSVIARERHLEINEYSVNTVVRDSTGVEYSEAPEITLLPDGTTNIVIPSSSEMRPGKYSLSVTVEKEGTPPIELNQDFLWGVVAINSPQSTYRPNEIVDLYMSVLNTEGTTICDADIDLVITSPTGTMSSYSTENDSIQRSESCAPHSVTYLPDYLLSFSDTTEPGTYILNAKITHPEINTKVESSFRIENDPAFVITRNAPTRIYPASRYETEITVFSKTGYKGVIKEHVPKIFSEIETDAFVEILTDHKTLSWNVDIPVGEKISVKYSYKPPYISPEMFLLGPLKLDGYIEPRQWHIASDAIGDFATYRESTGLDLINTTVTNLNWDTTVASSSTFTLQGNGIDIDLADAGHYLVMYSVPTEANSGDNLRNELQSWLRINDTTNLIYGRGQGYNRFTANNYEAYNSGAAIIEVNAGDDIRLQMQRTDSSSATSRRRANKSGIDLLKLNDDYYYIRTRPTTNQSVPTNNSWTDISFATDDELDSTGYSRSGADITLKDVGHYLITYNVGFATTGTVRVNNEARLTLGASDTEINGTRTTTYIRGTDGTNDGMVSWIGIIETSSTNQILNLEYRLESTSNPQYNSTKASETGLTAVKLPDYAEYIRLDETLGGQDLSTSQTAVTWDNTLEEDNGSFTHDPTYTERININQNGDYLFLHSMYALKPTGSSVRETQFLQWQKNSGLYPYGSSGAFNRGEQGGNNSYSSGSSGGLIANSLTNTDYIELTQINEASNSTAVYTAGYMGLQGLNLDSLTVSDPITQQSHYRWRDDSTALNSDGGWLASEDTSTGITFFKYENYRIRIAVANIGTGAESASRNYELQFADKGAETSCSSVTGWTGVANSSTDEINMYDSSNITSDGQGTSQLFANIDGYSFTTGEGRDLSDTTGSIGPLNNLYYTELEYTVRISDQALTGSTYCLRLYDTANTEELNQYNVFPEIILESAGLPLAPTMEWGTQSSVTDTAWTTVNFSKSYANPVFFCSAEYNHNIGNEGDGDADALTCRINNVSSTSAQVRLQEPGSSTLATNETIHWIVVDEGAYDTPEIKFEAFKYLSTVTDGKTAGYTGETQSYTNSYTSPAVLGSIESYNDTNFSYFYAKGSGANATLPSSSSLITGKHVAEDSNTSRNNETISVLVVESGHGTLNNGDIEYEANQTTTAPVDRIEENPPYTVSFSTPFSSTPTVAIVSQNGISGSDGPSVNMYGNSILSTTNIDLAVMEDEITDTEQTGNTENLSYFVLESSGIFHAANVGFDQDKYRFYENKDSSEPDTALSSENTNISGISINDVVRLRVGTQAADTIDASAFSLKLQYVASSDCPNASGWTDVDSSGGSGIWRGYNNASVTDGVTLSTNLLTNSNIKQTYIENGAMSGTNPNAISTGDRSEWDWVIQNNGAVGSTNYCFRLVDDNGITMNYTLYPQISTASVTNTNPDNPSSMDQKRSTNSISIPIGVWVNENSIKFTALASDYDSGDTLQLCVENQPIGTNFTNTETNCGSGVLYSGSPVTVETTISGLNNDDYHWQARIKDDSSAYSNWVSFEANPEGEIDYGVDLAGPLAGSVFDGEIYLNDSDINDGSLSTFIGSWSGFTDALSGISHWEYALGTSPGGTDVENWTEAVDNGNLFNDGFETGDLIPWDTLSTDGGDLTVVPHKSHTGNYSVSYLIDDVTALYVQDDLSSQTNYHARVYINLVDLTIGSGEEFVFWQLMDTITPYAEIKIGNDGSNYYLKATELVGNHSTTNVSITSSGWVDVEIHWFAGTNSYLSMFVNSIEYTTATTDTSLLSINKMRFGMIYGRDNGTSGTYYMDNFTSDNLEYQGPIEYHTATITGIGHLRTGLDYYLSIRGVDNAGNTGSPTSSDGFTVLPTFAFSLNNSSISFVNLNFANSWTDTQAIQTSASTNAHEGYTTYIYTTQPFTNTLSPTYTIPNYSGTNSVPTTWSGTGFGYTTSDNNLTGGMADRFTNGGPKYSGFLNAGPGVPVADHTTNITGTTGALINQQFDITLRVTADGGQAAGPYSTDIVFIAIPNF